MIFESLVSYLKLVVGKNAVIPDARRRMAGFLLGSASP